jgi:hypothetical protein
MILAADYRRRAEDCARLAKEAQDDFHRKNFSELAAMWAEMAEKADGRADVVVRMREREAAERVAERKALEQKTIDEALATIKNADAN